MKSGARCAQCGAELGPVDSRTLYCSPRCRWRRRDALRAADPAWRARWREASRRRYAALTPEERAAYITRVKERRAKRQAAET
jgi:hypothetical protein